MCPGVFIFIRQACRKKTLNRSLVQQLQMYSFCVFHPCVFVTLGALGCLEKVLVFHSVTFYCFIQLNCSDSVSSLQIRYLCHRSVKTYRLEHIFLAIVALHTIAHLLKTDIEFAVRKRWKIRIRIRNTVGKLMHKKRHQKNGKLREMKTN